MEERFERYHPDMEAFHHNARTQPCFVCEVLAGTNYRPQHIIHEDNGEPRATFGADIRVAQKVSMVLRFWCKVFVHMIYSLVSAMRVALRTTHVKEEP